MGQTPNQFGANSSDQEQWVLDGQLYSGNPAQVGKNDHAPSVSNTVSPSQNPVNEASFSVPNGNGAAPLPTAFPAGGATPSQPAGNGGAPLPIPPRYPDSDYSWNTNSPAGMPVTPGPGNMAAGSFSGLGGGSSYPPRPVKSRAVPITVLVVGIVMMLVAAPLAFFGLIIGWATDTVSDFDMLEGKNSIERVDEFSGHTALIVESSNPKDVKCEATFNGEVIEPESGDSFGVALAESLQEDKNGSAVYSYAISGSGKLKVDCTSSSNTQIESIGLIPNLSFGFLGWVFGIPTLIGLAGLGLMIWGIVWTVKRGRDNRQALITASYYR